MMMMMIAMYSCAIAIPCVRRGQFRYHRRIGQGHPNYRIECHFVSVRDVQFVPFAIYDERTTWTFWRRMMTLSIHLW